ncbi:hypothetical protein NL676_014089 [Syzygium grande]|nr:hypothetical protein NL676_014089 [Syzygium grande]
MDSDAPTTSARGQSVCPCGGGYQRSGFGYGKLVWWWISKKWIGVGKGSINRYAAYPSLKSSSRLGPGKGKYQREWIYKEDLTSNLDIRFIQLSEKI